MGRTVPRAPMAKITKIITTKIIITTTTIRRIRAKTIENLEQRQVHRVLIVLLRGPRIMAIITTTTTTTTTIIIITTTRITIKINQTIITRIAGQITTETAKARRTRIITTKIGHRRRRRMGTKEDTLRHIKEIKEIRIKIKGISIGMVIIIIMRTDIDIIITTIITTIIIIEIVTMSMRIFLC